MEKQSQRESREYRLSFGRLLSRWPGRKGLIEPRRELHVAWDDLKRRMAATGAVPRQPVAGIRGVGHAAGSNRFPNARLKWKAAGASCESS